MTGLDLFFALSVLVFLLVAIAYISRFGATLAPSGDSGALELDREIIDLQDRKDHLLEDLRDLELDFRMGKIAESEYVQRKAKLEPATVAVIKALEARGVGLSPLDDLAEDELDEDEWNDELSDDETSTP